MTEHEGVQELNTPQGAPCSQSVSSSITIKAGGLSVCCSKTLKHVTQSQIKKYIGSDLREDDVSAHYSSNNYENELGICHSTKKIAQ